MTWAQRLKRVFGIDTDKSAGQPICTAAGCREAVVAQLNGRDSEKLYVTAITIGEIAYGLRSCPIANDEQGFANGLNDSLTLP